MTQARRLYADLDIRGLLELAGKGWNVQPNFHLAHIRRNVLWTKPTMSVADYLAFWKKQQSRSSIEQIEIVDADLFTRVVDQWHRLGLADDQEREKIHAEFTHTNRKKVNVCPGLAVESQWDAKAAADLDGRGIFVKEVRSRIQEALATWGQHF